MTEKICPRCQKKFSCSSPEPGCWCGQYVISKEKLEEIDRLYDGCLCPECLALFSEKKLPD